jgi:hypothetical protein
MKRCANEFNGLEFKIFKKNDEPDYIIISAKDITENTFVGFSDTTELQINDTVSGVIEEEQYGIKIRYEAIVSSIERYRDKFFFEFSFIEEIELPEIFVAKSMAVAI